MHKCHFSFHFAQFCLRPHACLLRNIKMVFMKFDTLCVSRYDQGGENGRQRSLLCSGVLQDDVLFQLLQSGHPRTLQISLFCLLTTFLTAALAALVFEYQRQFQLTLFFIPSLTLTQFSLRKTPTHTALPIFYSHCLLPHGSDCRFCFQLFGFDDPARPVRVLLGEGRTDDGQVVLPGVLNQQPIDKSAVFVLLLQPRQTAPEPLLQRHLDPSPNAALLLLGLRKKATAGPHDFVGMGEHFSGGGGVFHVKQVIIIGTRGA